MTFEEFWYQIETDIIPQLKVSKVKHKNGLIKSLRSKKQYLIDLQSNKNLKGQNRVEYFSHTWLTIAWYLNIIQHYCGISTKRLYDSAHWNGDNEIELNDNSSKH